jgi:hypothetical protein
MYIHINICKNKKTIKNVDYYKNSKKKYKMIRLNNIKIIDTIYINTMSAVSAFNKILIEFAKNLETTFPEDNDFIGFRVGIETLVKYNSGAAIQLFKVYLEPTLDKNNNQVDIKQKILDNDASFFLEQMDYADKIRKTSKDNSTSANAFQTIDKLKLYWTKLSTQGQVTVMKYLNTLVKVADQS